MAEKQLAGPNSREGKQGGNTGQSPRAQILSELNVLIDGDGKSSGLARYVAGDHNRSAKFPKSASQGQHGAGKHTAPGEREDDGEKDSPFAGSERPCHLFIEGIYFFKCRTHCPDKKRERHDCQSNRDGAPGENYVEAEGVVQPTPERSAASEELQEHQAGSDWRQDQGQCDKCFDYGFATGFGFGQPPG